MKTINMIFEKVLPIIGLLFSFITTIIVGIIFLKYPVIKKKHGKLIFLLIPLQILIFGLIFIGIFYNNNEESVGCNILGAFTNFVIFVYFCINIFISYNLICGVKKDNIPFEKKFNYFIIFSFLFPIFLTVIMIFLKLDGKFIYGKEKKY